MSVVTNLLSVITMSEDQNEPQKKSKKPGCLLTAFLVIGGFVLLVNVLINLSPYRVKCSSGNSISNSGFTDQASADAAYQKNTAAGMSCSKEYRN
jgi:hypothetical protein